MRDCSDKPGALLHVPIDPVLHLIHCARGHFPNDEAAMKLLYLVLNLAQKDWKMPPKEWTTAKTQFAIVFEDRFKLN